MGNGHLKPQQLSSALIERLGASHVEVRDSSGGCGQAFEVVVVSEQFKGKSRLARHRAVNNALTNEIAAIHAFTQKAYTPEEYEKLSANKS